MHIRDKKNIENILISKIYKLLDADEKNQDTKQILELSCALKSITDINNVAIDS